MTNEDYKKMFEELNKHLNEARKIIYKINEEKRKSYLSKTPEIISISYLREYDSSFRLSELEINILCHNTDGVLDFNKYEPASSSFTEIDTKRSTVMNDINYIEYGNWGLRK